LDKKQKIMEDARETVGDQKKLRDVLSKSTSKLKKLVGDSSEWKELKSKVNVLIAMVQAHLSGKYKAFSNSSLLLVVFGLVYFITPTDVIPDFIPALGLTDDASVLYLIYRKLSKDIEAYLQWSKERQPDQSTEE